KIDRVGGAAWALRRRRRVRRPVRGLVERAARSICPEIIGRDGRRAGQQRTEQGETRQEETHHGDTYGESLGPADDKPNFSKREGMPYVTAGDRPRVGSLPSLERPPVPGKQGRSPEARESERPAVTRPGRTVAATPRNPCRR